MDKKQCIFLRKTSTDRLEVSGGTNAGGLHFSSLLKDVSTGSMVDPVAGSNSAGLGTYICAATSGWVNDRCLEDLTILNADSVNATVTLELTQNNGAIRGRIWRGILTPNQRLRYREDTGFVVA